MERGGYATASLSERERRMLMLHQRRETLMRVARAVGDRGIVHVERIGGVLINSPRA